MLPQATDTSGYWRYNFREKRECLPKIFCVGTRCKKVKSSFYETTGFIQTNCIYLNRFHLFYIGIFGDVSPPSAHNAILAADRLPFSEQLSPIISPDDGNTCFRENRPGFSTTPGHQQTGQDNIHLYHLDNHHPIDLPNRDPLGYHFTLHRSSRYLLAHSLV